MGEVGAVFGLEVSRFGRSNADLTRLMELARLTDTLLIDADGVYDLGNVNDRLLLGLKGQMSEALSRRLDKASLIVPCCRVDWRTYTTASRSRCSERILPST